MVRQQGRDQRKRTQKAARSPNPQVVMAAVIRVQARIVHQTMASLGIRLLPDRTTATVTQMKVPTQATVIKIGETNHKPKKTKRVMRQHRTQLLPDR